MGRNDGLYDQAMRGFLKMRTPFSHEEKMSEQEIVEHLQFLLDQSSEARKDEGWPEEMLGNRTGTFEENGVLTDNKGFVLILKDRSEYQVTVVRSRIPGPVQSK